MKFLILNFLAAIIVILSLYLFYNAVLLIASVLLIQGTKRRNHSKMILFMLMMVIGLFSAFIQVFAVGLVGLPSAVVIAGLSFYFLICTCSLHNKIKVDKIKGASIAAIVLATQSQYSEYLQKSDVQETKFNQPPMIVVQADFAENSSTEDSHCDNNLQTGKIKSELK